MLGEMLQNVRENRPLVHCITNYVTANDCANLLLACGGSAIMADEMEEAEEVTSLCGGLVLNLGTPNPRKVEAMLRAGREANRMGRPVVFDPVGVGCSAFRREAGSRILEQVQLSVIRGNASEIAARRDGAAWMQMLPPLRQKKAHGCWRRKPARWLLRRERPIWLRMGKRSIACTMDTR